MLSQAIRVVRDASIVLLLLAVPSARAQVLNETFSAATLNTALWFQDATGPNVSAPQASGRLQFRTTVNNSLGADQLSYAATSLEPGIGVLSSVQASVRMNLTKATPAQSNYDEGLAIHIGPVEGPAPSGNEPPEGLVFAIGSYYESELGTQHRYMTLIAVDGLGNFEPLMYAEESPAGKFTDYDYLDGKTFTVPATGEIPVFFSFVKGSSNWTLRVGFTSFANTTNAFSTTFTFDEIGDRPYRPTLAGYAIGPIKVALTGARSYFDDFVVQQGALSYRPSGLAATQGTSLTAVNLTWTAASGATSYRVYRMPNTDTPIATVTGTSYSDTGASPGIPTSYVVRAFSATAGLSEYSESATGFRKPPVPTVTAVTPASGPLAGSTTITVTGTGFVPGLTTVKVGTATATTVTVNSARTSLTAKTPAGTAGVKSVSVTTSGGTATKENAFTYVVPAPTVATVSPATGPTTGNTLITVTGTNFVTGATTVTVGGVAATSVSVTNATTLTARTPAGAAGAKAVAVTTAGGTNSKANAFTYVVPAPTVATVSPATGPTTGNTLITVTGTNFVTGATTVTVGGVAATSVSVTNATTLTARTPAGAVGAKAVAVTTAGGTNSKANAFTYVVPAPTVATVSPATGPTTGNTLITVTGTNFVTGATTVTVGGVAATSVSVTNATTLTARTPAGAAGAKAVAVTTAGGTNSKANAFTYVAGAGMPTPPGGGTGGGTDGGSSSAGMTTAQGAGSVGGGSSSGTGTWTAAGGWSSRSTWLPDTGIPALDGYLVLSGAEATVGSRCGDVPASDLDADGEADLCQLRRGDLDLDGDVDATDADLVMLLVGRESADGIADLDGDGWVTLLDVAVARSAGATLASTPR